VGASYEIRDGRFVVVPGGQVDLKTPADVHVFGLARLDKRAYMGHERRIRTILDSPLTLHMGVDANTPLRDMLEFLADRCSLTIQCDSGAFGGHGLSEVEAAPIKLPAQTNVPVGVVLQTVLDQVNATFEVYEDVILVVPK
jgi:hypothetical protein